MQAVTGNKSCLGWLGHQEKLLSHRVQCSSSELLALARMGGLGSGSAGAPHVLEDVVALVMCQDPVANAKAAVTTRIEGHGGRVVARLGRDVSHIVWERTRSRRPSDKAADEAQLLELFHKLEKVGGMGRGPGWGWGDGSAVWVCGWVCVWGEGWGGGGGGAGWPAGGVTSFPCCPPSGLAELLSTCCAVGLPAGSCVAAVGGGEHQGWAAPGGAQILGGVSARGGFLCAGRQPVCSRVGAGVTVVMGPALPQRFLVHRSPPPASTLPGSPV